MPTQRAILIAAGAAITVISMPAAAQVPDNVVLNIMRECAKIDDPTARLACYDNNIRSAGGNPRSVPGQGPVVNGGSAPGASSRSGAGGFGAEDIRTPDRFLSNEARGNGPDSVTSRVTTAQQREPGVYIVTLEDGAQWQFAEAVSRSFRAPKKGSNVKIERASLGSFLMVVDGQAAVRVRRVR